MKKENLLQIAQGFALIATAYEAEALGADVSNVVADKPAVSNKAPKKEAPVVDAVEDEEEGYSLAELKAMKLPELKQLADDNGIEYGSKVKKDDLIDLIMDEEDDVSEVEAEEEAEPEEEEVDGEELTAEDLEDMKLSELKELAEEYDVEYAKGTKAPALRAILIEALFSDDEEEEAEVEEEGDEEGDELTPEDLEDMTLKELKELATEYEVEFPKVVKAPKLREILIEALWSDDEEEEEEDGTDLDEVDYAEQLGLNDMDVEELTELLVSHGIKAKGKKQALIARVVEAIEEGVIEVEDEEGE